MLKNILFVLVFSGIFLTQYAQSTSQDFAETITADELKTFVYKLAGDEFQGRETGRKGQKLAAAYLVDYFKTLGMPEYIPGYLQNFVLEGETGFNEIQVSWDGNTLSEMKDFISPGGFSTFQVETSGIVFAGYGSSNEGFNELSGLNLGGKTVAIIMEEPIDKNGGTFSGTNAYEIYKGAHIFSRLKAIQQAGAANVIILCKNLQKTMQEGKLSGFMKDNSSYLPYIFMDIAFIDQKLSAATYKSIAAYEKQIKKKKAPVSMEIPATFYMQVVNIEVVTGDNVIGFIEGTDLKDEIIVITAHYDHLGIHEGKTYYGADDDGSGTAAIMEIAEAFMIAKAAGAGPRRSILIMPVSGEEKGLLGSDYYVSNPVFPLKQTVANLNVDMIGREDKAHKGNDHYVYIIGSDKLSTDLHQINETANKNYTGLTLDYTYNAPDDPNQFYYRSDHYNFAKHNIPVIFYFTGVHADYHQPTDTPEKLDYNKVQNITRLIFHTAWELANRDNAPVVDKKNAFPSWR